MEKTNEIEKIKIDDVEYIRFKRLIEMGINHAFFTRHGGVSIDEYESLNFRLTGKDTMENVLKNLEKTKLAGFTYKNTVKVLQVHGTDSIKIDDKNYTNYLFYKNPQYKADAIITSEKSIPILITTADCTPIIIVDSKQKVIANIHSGWRGTCNNIYIKTIENMQKAYGSKIEDLIVAIGPCIRKCCWTTENEQDIQMIKNEYKIEKIEKVKNKYHVDFIETIKDRLNEMGVKNENILDCNICTCCNVEDYFSCRYNNMRNIKDFGTQATIAEIM